MPEWDADHYLRFGQERTRPAFELAARIQIAEPRFVVDIGCGPGNSTQVVRARWPEARVVGVDNSPQMIQSARNSFPDYEWVLADAAQWSSNNRPDVVFSNAALQWLPDHASLISRLFSMVAEDGAMGFQVPCDRYAAVRQHIRDISTEPQWDDRMESPRSALTMHDPAFYYDVLATTANRLDVWETEYAHVMENSDAIVDWISSTGLRPYLGVLNEDEQSQFLEMLRKRVAESYPVRADGKVLFPFRRLFVIAYR